MSTPDLELVTAWQRHVSHHVDLLERLLSRHREKQRRYHTAAHVGWVIRHVDELHAAAPARHLDEVIAAAFYHDAIYEPTHPANERASARLARRDLAVLEWASERIDRVAAMIEATAHTDAPPPATTDHDTAMLLDADLAILGADPAAYNDYASGVRAEYGHVDDVEWSSGRARVLESFLERPAIYTTAPGAEWWEARARANLTAELATLR